MSVKTTKKEKKQILINIDDILSTMKEYGKWINQQ